MQISQFFVNRDIKGAIAYMRNHEEFKDILPAYVAIFEDQKYRTYEIPDNLNDILRLYQIYFRDTFYCGSPEAEAADKLRTGLKALLNTPDAGDGLLTEQLQSLFGSEGYHALFGKTQGYYGPYVWRNTVPTTYRVELPDGTAEYTVNILKGFVFRSWMDYLTFGRYGTGGWASPDGTINCIEQAYDFESERFLVSLLMLNSPLSASVNVGAKERTLDAVHPAAVPSNNPLMSSIVVVLPVPLAIIIKLLLITEPSALVKGSFKAVIFRIFLYSSSRIAIFIPEYPPHHPQSV